MQQMINKCCVLSGKMFGSFDRGFILINNFTCPNKKLLSFCLLLLRVHLKENIELSSIAELDAKTIHKSIAVGDHSLLTLKDRGGGGRIHPQPRLSPQCAKTVNGRILKRCNF